MKNKIVHIVTKKESMAKHETRVKLQLLATNVLYNDSLLMPKFAQLIELES